MIILGGTFDPPHIGHLVAAECARYQFGDSAVRFMPTGDPYRKSRDRGLPVSPSATRLEMVHLAVDDNPAFVVDELEVARPGATYTVDTLRYFHDEGYRRDNLVLVLGADAILDMDHWRDPADIVAMARIAVAPKVGVALLNDALPPGAEWLDMPALDVSSTMLRDRVRQGAPIRYLVPPAVERFIEEQQLYRDP